MGILWPAVLLNTLGGTVQSSFRLSFSSNSQLWGPYSLRFDWDRSKLLSSVIDFQPEGFPLVTHAAHDCWQEFILFFVI